MSKLSAIGNQMNAKAMLAQAVDGIKEDDKVCMVVISKDRRPRIWMTELTPQELAFAAAIVQQAFVVRMRIIDNKDGKNGT